MRFRSGILFCLLALVAACEPALEPGPRVNFISSSRFNASNRRLTTPGDTIPIKIYAESQGGDGGGLQRVVIRASYTPEARPIVYGPLYTRNDAPRSELVYLDTVISTNQFAFQSTQPTRTTAGREEWRYEVTDSENRTGVSSFYVQLNRTDSAAAIHSYTITLQAPGAYDRRSFLALREGLALPKFTVRTLAANQALVDLVYVPRATGAPTLVTTTDTALKLSWASPRRTEIRSTSLTIAAFDAANDASAITAAFPATGVFTPLATNTGPLLKDQVIAFQTPDGKYGLIAVQEIITTARIRAVVLRVRVTK